jgi:Fe-Mn family superoxide dismutase
MNTTSPANYEAKKHLKPKGLTGLSQALIDQHWALYEGYVTNVNLLDKLIWECLQEGKPLQTPPFSELERRLGFEYNGMILHEYYFGGLAAGVPEPKQSSKLAQRFAKDFGSFEKWKRQFSEIGKMRGIGWVITALDPSTKRLLNFWVTDHQLGNVSSFIPVVVMDVWEHAYILDYGAKADGRTAYIETYFKNLNWEMIEGCLALADQSKVWPRDAVITGAATSAR